VARAGGAVARGRGPCRSTPCNAAFSLIAIASGGNNAMEPGKQAFRKLSPKTAKFKGKTGQFDRVERQ